MARVVQRGRVSKGKHAVSKIRRAVSIKIVVESSKRCNIAVVKGLFVPYLY